jgi:hypothetical protein
MKNIILIFILLIAFNSSAQECGTPISTTNQVFNIPTNNDAQYCVNVKFHIVRESNGTGGFNASQIPSLINYINQFYNSISINVASAGFDYINNSVLFNINDIGDDSTEFNQLITNNNVSNAINFYIVNSANYNGRAGAIISNNLVVRIDKVFAPTSPHEIGHCFNLLHTFQGTASGTEGCAENINGSNCSSCGDNVCDTPADANIEATGGYSPDLTNIMSYYLKRNHFTVQQGARMRNAIGGSPILRTTLSSQCASITGTNNICATSNTQYTLSNPENSTVVWTVSSNLQIISYSNTGVTINAINSTSSEQGFITANVNGISVTKTVWIGKPNSYYTAERVEYCNFTYRAKDYPGTNQGSTYTWQYISGTGGASASNFSSYGDFANFTACPPFSITMKMIATNNCGTTEEEVSLWLNNDQEEIQRVANPKETKTLDNLSFENKLNKTQMNSSLRSNVYPNPSSDIINIQINDTNIISKTTDSKIVAKLYDLLGKQKREIKIINNSASLNVHDLQKGIYILKIIIDKKIESHKIIVE